MRHGELMPVEVTSSAPWHGSVTDQLSRSATMGSMRVERRAGR